MKKLLPLLSVLFLICFSCSKNDIQYPVGENFKVLNISKEESDYLDQYYMDILYEGEIKYNSIVSLVKKIHFQYSELILNVWLSEQSYNKYIDGVLDGSMDKDLIIKSEKSFVKKENNLRWVQFFGKFEKLLDKKVFLSKIDSIDKNKGYQLKNNQNSDLIDNQVLTVVTDFNCRILSIPDSFGEELTRIPKDTKLDVYETREVQQGRVLGTWYKIRYNGHTGWTSGFNMKVQPELKVLSVEESYKNYEKQIGKKPVHNPLTGKNREIDRWLKKNKNNYKSIKYRQWYEPYVENHQWVCRVQYDEKFGEYIISSDMIFYFFKGNIVRVIDKLSSWEWKL